MVVLVSPDPCARQGRAQEDEDDYVLIEDDPA